MWRSMSAHRSLGVNQRPRQVHRQIKAELRHFPSASEVNDVFSHPKFRLGDIRLRDSVGDAFVRCQHPAVGRRQQGAEDFERRKEEKADRLA